MAIQEPFCKRSKLDKYNNWLRYHYAYANCNNKIWIFSDKDFILSVLSDGEQQLTCSLESEEKDITITTIYAKSKVPLREPLWEELRQTYSNHMKEWMVMGDFNCIIEPSERIGGNSHIMEKSLPLIECMTNCELNDLGYIGSTYTWCNLRTPSERICQRLDRALANQEWLSKFPNTTVTLLVRK